MCYSDVILCFRKFFQGEMYLMHIDLLKPHEWRYTQAGTVVVKKLLCKIWTALKFVSVKKYRLSF